MCWTSVIRHRVRPKLLRHWTEPSCDSQCPRVITVSLVAGGRQRTPLRFVKVATGSESSGDEFGVLEDDRCVDTGVFQQRYLVHKLVFACSPPPPPRSQISLSVLAQAEWCAIRAVARCELGLHPIIKTAETGARVYWH